MVDMLEWRVGMRIAETVLRNICGAFISNWIISLIRIRILVLSSFNVLISPIAASLCSSCCCFTTGKRINLDYLIYSIGR